jgi:hypothetical protein
MTAFAYHQDVRHRPNEENEPEYVGLDQAFNDLSRDAFALWLRLHTVEAVFLRKGCNALAASIGVAPRSLYRWIGELRARRYIRVRSRGRGGKLRIEFRRRALIVTSSAFVAM